MNDKRLVLVLYNLLFVGEGVRFRVDFDTTDNTVYRNSKHSIPEIQRQFSTPSVSNATSGRRCSLIIIDQTQKQCNLLTNRETLHTKNDFRNVVASKGLAIRVARNSQIKSAGKYSHFIGSALVTAHLRDALGFRKHQSLMSKRCRRYARNTESGCKNSSQCTYLYNSTLLCLSYSSL